MPSILDRTRALLLALAGIALVSGCDKVTGLNAQYPNAEEFQNVWAMNGTPVTLPSGLAIKSLVPVRIDATFLFDLAFDLDSQNVVQVYTLSRVANQLVGTHQVGIQLTTTPFASITKAPTAGYAFDTVMALPIGKTIIVNVVDNACSSSFLGTSLYSKISVDSINVTTRAIYLHYLADLNCGFRGLDQGTPKG